jgi:hypothetical protein
MQRPPVHVPAQVTPQPPQLLLSVCVLTHCPEHIISRQVHAPALQSGVGWAHAGPAFCHLPDGSQVCGWLPVQTTVVLGVHTPEQTPATHAWLVQGDGVVPHVPSGAQVTTAFPMHSVVPGEQPALPSQALGSGGPHVSLGDSQMP